MRGCKALLSLRSSVILSTMSSLYRQLLIVVLFCCVIGVPGEEQKGASVLAGLVDGGMEAEGIRAPYYDEEGNLKALMYGRRAKVLEGEMTDVADLRIDLYKDGKVDAIIYAPQCLAHSKDMDGQKILIVESEGDVLVEMEGVTLVGRGFQFRSDQNRFKILHDARVIVDEAVRDSTELDL